MMTSINIDNFITPILSHDLNLMIMTLLLSELKLYNSIEFKAMIPTVHLRRNDIVYKPVDDYITHRKEIIICIAKLFPDIYSALDSIDYEDSNYFNDKIINKRPNLEILEQTLHQYNNDTIKICKLYYHWFLSKIMTNFALNINKQVNPIENIDTIKFYINKKCLELSSTFDIDINTTYSILISNLSAMWKNKSSLDDLDLVTLMTNSYVRNSLINIDNVNVLYKLVLLVECHFFTRTGKQYMKYLLIPDLMGEKLGNYIRIDLNEYASFANGTAKFNDDMEQFCIEATYYGNSEEQYLYSNLEYVTSYIYTNIEYTSNNFNNNFIKPFINKIKVVEKEKE